MVQPGVVNNSVLRVDASEMLTAQLSQGGSLGGVKPDLIVWGESSIGEDLTLPSSSALLRQIEKLSAEDGAEILVSQDATPPGKGHEKWAVLVSPSGIKGIYVKTRLVPFGEYIPFRQQLGWLTDVSKAAGSNMVPGDGAHLLNATDRAGRPLPIGVLVCFESAFPDMSRVDADHGAQLIVYQSSDVDVPGHLGAGPAGVARGAARRGDRQAGRAGRADRRHGGVRRPRPATGLAGPVGPRRGDGQGDAARGHREDVLRPGRRLRHVDRRRDRRARRAGHARTPARFSRAWHWYLRRAYGTI